MRLKHLHYLTPLFFIINISCRYGYQEKIDQVPILKTAESHNKVYKNYKPNNDVLLTIKQISEVFNKKDQKSINKYIHPDVGIYILFRRGTVDEWSKESSLCLVQNCFNESKIPWWFKETLKTQKIVIKEPIEETNTSIFIECDSIRKKGNFIVNNLREKTLLSRTIKQFLKISYYDENTVIKDNKKLSEELLFIKKWENYTKPVIIAHTIDNSLIFYLTQIDNLWYLSLIDFVTSDCSI